MQKAYLGDALDLWKAAMLRTVRKRGRHLCVVSMMSDSPWKKREVSTYASLLGVSEASVASAEFPGKQRSSYFEIATGIMCRSDFFVDPDIGLHGRASAHHVTPSEVASLLSDGNMVAIYQHSRREKGWIEKSAKLISREHVVGYEGTHVGMLFVTRSKLRAREIRGSLKHLLGTAAKTRVFYQPPRRSG